MEPTTTIEVDGMTVAIYIDRTEDGPVLVLGGEGVELEGIAPGEYLVHAAS